MIGRFNDDCCATSTTDAVSPPKAVPVHPRKCISLGDDMMNYAEFLYYTDKLREKSVIEAEDVLVGLLRSDWWKLEAADNGSAMVPDNGQARHSPKRDTGSGLNLS